MGTERWPEAALGVVWKLAADAGRAEVVVHHREVQNVRLLRLRFVDLCGPRCATQTDDNEHKKCDNKSCHGAILS